MLNCFGASVLTNRRRDSTLRLLGVHWLPASSRVRWFADPVQHRDPTFQIAHFLLAPRVRFEFIYTNVFGPG